MAISFDVVKRKDVRKAPCLTNPGQSRESALFAWVPQPTSPGYTSSSFKVKFLHKCTSLKEGPPRAGRWYDNLSTLYLHVLTDSGSRRRGQRHGAHTAFQVRKVHNSPPRRAFNTLLNNQGGPSHNPQRALSRRSRKQQVSLAHEDSRFDTRHRARCSNRLL